MGLTDVSKKAPERRNKVIFVNRFYWPDQSATSQLLTDLAEHLATTGVDVSVVTSRLNYVSEDLLLAPDDSRNGVRIHRVWTTSFHRRSIWGRMLDFLTFYISSTWTLLRIVRRGDTVIAKTDPPLIQVFAWFATRIRGARLVNWCQDIFPEILFALEMQKAEGTIGFILSKVRNFALRNSAMNVTVSREMRETLVVQGISEARVCVIRNWCDRLIVPVADEANTLKSQWSLEDHFVIGYSGNLGRAHIADKVYALVDELARDDGIKFVFIGSGHGMRWLREQCEQSGHRHVIFKPHQPNTRLSFSLSLPDLHLISLGRRCNEFLSPSKFYGVLAAGRPIAFLGDPNCDLAKEIVEMDLGVTLDIDNTASWRPQILDLVSNRSRLGAMTANARNAHEVRFEAQHSLEAWQQIIQPSPTRSKAAEPSRTLSTVP